MTEYKEVQTTLIIQDQEYPCTFSFDYSPAEPLTRMEPGCAEEIQITGAVIQPRPDLTVDLFCPAYDFLMINELYDALVEEAEYHIKDITEEYENDKADYLYQCRTEAA